MNNAKRSNKQFSSMLKRLGIPLRIKGYRFIEAGLSFFEDDILMIDLYKLIAIQFDTNSSCVERNIRYAIEIGFVRCDTCYMNELFGYNVDPNKAKPTNSEFMFTLFNELKE